MSLNLEQGFVVDPGFRLIGPGLPLGPGLPSVSDGQMLFLGVPVERTCPAPAGSFTTGVLSDRSRVRCWRAVPLMKP